MINNPDWGDLPIDEDMCLNARSLPAAFAARVNHLLPLFNYFIECLYNNFALDRNFPLPDLVVPDCVQDGDFWAADRAFGTAGGEEGGGLSWYLYAMARWAVDWEEIDHAAQLYPPEYQGNDNALLPAPRGLTERYNWSAVWKGDAEDVAKRNKSRIILAANALLTEGGVGAHVFTDNTLSTGSFFEGDYSHCPKYLNRLWAVLKILSDSFALDFMTPAHAPSDHCLVEVDYHSQYGEGIAAESHGGGIHWHIGETTCAAMRSAAISSYATAGSVAALTHKKSWTCGVLCDLTASSGTSWWGGYWNTSYYTSKVKLQDIPSAVTLSAVKLVAWLRMGAKEDAHDVGDEEDGDLLVIQSAGTTTGSFTSQKVISNAACPIGGWDGTTCGDQHEVIGPHDQSISEFGSGSLYVGGVLKSIVDVDGIDGPGWREEGPYWDYESCTTLYTWSEVGGTATIEADVWTGGGNSYEYFPRLIVKNEATP